MSRQDETKRYAVEDLHVQNPTKPVPVEELYQLAQTAIPTPLPPNDPRTLAQWCYVAYANSKAHGFHDVEGDGTPARMPERQALLHSEVSELFESFRVDPYAPCDKPGLQLSAAAEELADIVIRLFDFVGEFHIDADELFAANTFTSARSESVGWQHSDWTLGEEICAMHRTIGLLSSETFVACGRLFRQCVRFAIHHNYDLELAVQTKHVYNVNRPHMHGKKF